MYVPSTTSQLMPGMSAIFSGAGEVGYEVCRIADDDDDDDDDDLLLHDK